MTSKERSTQLPIQWLSNLKTEEEKKEFLDLVSYNSRVLLRLREILQEKYNSLESTETTLSDFSDPNWAHKQAFRNGEKTGLKEALALLKFLKG